MILFMDGCSHYGSSQLGKKWAGISPGTATWTIAAEGRTDKCIKKTLVGNGAPGYLVCTPLFTQNGVWTPTAGGRIGFAMKVDDITLVAGTVGGPNVDDLVGTLITIYYGNRSHCGIAMNPNGTFSVYRTGVGGTLGSSVQGFTSGNWAYIEIQWVISGTGTGSIVIRSNNTTILNLQNITTNYGNITQATPPSLWNSFRFLLPQSLSFSTPYVIRIADLYVADFVAPNDAFLGDITVAYINPMGAGAASEWTPTVAPNWDCVNGVPPNDTDTPSISAASVNLRDSYQMQDVIGNPLAIQTVHYARKTDEGAAGFKPSLRIGGTNYDSPNEQTLGSTSLAFKLQTMDRSPATNQPFTKTELDAAESGQVKTT